MAKVSTTRLHPEDWARLEGLAVKLADMIAARLEAAMNREHQLMNLTDLSEAIGVPYDTLTKKPLPYYQLDEGGRKLYTIRDVLGHLSAERQKQTWAKF